MYYFNIKSNSLKRQDAEKNNEKGRNAEDHNKKTKNIKKATIF